MTTRREVLAALSALAMPFDLHAQQDGKVWRIGFLAQRRIEFIESDYEYGPLMQGLRELGYVEGKHFTVEWRSAEGKTERLPALALELAKMKLDVLATGGTPAALAVQKATSTIPTVMINVGDPVGTGLVKSLARPGGNATALSNMNTELGAKLLEMLTAVVPKVKRVAFLMQSENPVISIYLKNVQAGAQKIGMTILPIDARTPQEISNAFAEMSRLNVGALIVPREPLFQQQRNQILDLVAKLRMPSIAAYGEYVEAGGLMSYGQNIRENYRRAAAYFDKIFKGAKAGDIPVEQPMRFELVVNLKTAKSLGLTIPTALMISANRVIE